MTRPLARIRSLWWMARLRWEASRCGAVLRLHPTLRLRARVTVRGRGVLFAGVHVVLGDPDAGRPDAPVLFAPRYHQTQIVLGSGTRLTNGVELIAVERIEIGRDCLIGSGTRIVDADFHGLSPQNRRGPGRSSPVFIGNNVWIGMGALILKGVRIGNDCVIGAGAVVVKDIPAAAVAAGNPARVIGNVNGIARPARLRGTA